MSNFLKLAFLAVKKIQLRQILIKVFVLFWKGAKDKSRRKYGRNLVLCVGIYAVLLWRSSSNVDPPEVVYYNKFLQKKTYLSNMIVAHLSLGKYLLLKTVRLLSVLIFVAVKTYRAPVAFVEQGSTAFQDSMQSRFELFLTTQMDSIGEKIKYLLKDEFMPEFLKSSIDDSVEILLPDLKLALLRKTDEYFQQNFSTKKKVAADLENAKALANRRRNLDVLDLDKVLDTLNDETEPEQKKRSPSFTISSINLHLLGRISSGSKDVYNKLSAISLPKKPTFKNFLKRSVEDNKNKSSDSLSSKSSSSSTESETVESIYLISPAVVLVTLREGWYSLPNLREIIITYKQKRAWILYALSPFDKSIWENFRNRRYWVLQLIGVTPYLSVPYWFLIFVISDKRDEYQLCQFIVSFQTAKFFSQGCFSLARGAFVSYYCALNGYTSCGPQTKGDIDSAIFFFQVFLVWISFFILPYSTQCCEIDDPSQAFLLDLSMKHGRRSIEVKARLGKGGRLMALFWLDTLAVFLILALMSLIYYNFSEDSFKANTSYYWVRTIYGLLSFPFVVFKLPVLGGLLTAAKPTGYNQEGKTVLKISGDNK
eukprot:maker-scaffold_14-snap-gene-5.67-mRNA-1 protein AED:0.36 eAED:0.38 QI:0/0/0/0.75/1/1/4/0/594